MTSGNLRFSPKREHAALLLAEAEMKAFEVAQAVGITDRTLRDWKAAPEFQSRIKEHVERIHAEMIADSKRSARAQRIRILNARLEKADRVIEERAADDKWAHIPGYSTGLMVHDVKFSPDGARYDVFSVDIGLMKTMDAGEKQIAQEMGQWTEKRELSGAHGKPLTIVQIPDDPERARAVAGALQELGIIAPAEMPAPTEATDG